MQIGYYEAVSLVLTAAILYGIKLMSSPKTAVRGNQVGALSMLIAVCLVLVHNNIVSTGLLWISLAIGSFIGYLLAARVAMTEMPQLVALFNGLGGGASLLVALVLVFSDYAGMDLFSRAATQLAIFVGGMTLSGSLMAAGKLHRLLAQRPVTLAGHGVLTVGTLVMMFLLCWWCAVSAGTVLSILVAILSLWFGVLFTLRIGGADMPVAISLLNSLSGLAGAITGFAIADPLLIAVGAIVGAAGLILTQIMCRGINRSLLCILTGGIAAQQAERKRQEQSAPVAEPDSAASTEPGSGKAETGIAASAATDLPQASQDTAVPGQTEAEQKAQGPEVPGPETPGPETAGLETPGPETPKPETLKPIDLARKWLTDARSVIIVPGYGMALAQAQEEVKKLLDRLESNGKKVSFAIHPVAGRMPGHMNVLLAEVDVPYDLLFEMDSINPEFSNTDVAIIVGACDVVNPAAIDAPGTPIYGMPILRVDEAKHIIVCNLNTEPGYSGVENPLYQKDNVVLLLGDAAETVAMLASV